MGSTGSVEYQRAANTAWRLAPDRVLVLRVSNEFESADEPTSADLLGPAALVWVAAEHASTLGSLAAQTDLDPHQVVEAADVLVDAGWLVQTAGSTDADQ